MSTLLRQYGDVLHWPPQVIDDLPDSAWQVLLARPRQEKLLRQDLQRLNIPNLLFIEHRVRAYAKGMQRFQVPLFGGYVFAALSREQRDVAYRTERVAWIIDVCDPAELAEHLRSLISLLACHRTAAGELPLVIRPELVPGVTVRISLGTFAGCTGVVTRRCDATTLVVNLPLLGHSVAATIPAQSAHLLSA